MLKPTKPVTMLFLGWIILCFIGIIIFIIFQIKDPIKDIGLLVVFLLLIIIFLSFGFGGYIHMKYNYFIVKDDRIIIKKGRKTSIVLFKDIIYFSANHTSYGGIECYNENGFLLLIVSNFYVGVEKLESILKKLNVQPLPTPFPTEQMKETEEYKLCKKVGSYKLKMTLSLVFSFMIFLIYFLLLSQSHFEIQETYEINGVIEEVTLDNKTITIYLENDNNKYFVNNVVYKAVDKNVFDELKKGTDINLHILDDDKYKHLEVYQIKINDVIYLSLEDAKRLEYNNHKALVISMYVFLGAGCILLIYASIYIIKLYKLNKIIKNKVFSNI